MKKGVIEPYGRQLCILLLSQRLCSIMCIYLVKSRSRGGQATVYDPWWPFPNNVWETLFSLSDLHEPPHWNIPPFRQQLSLM